MLYQYLKSGLLAGLLSLAAAFGAQATSVQYALSGFAFNDGGAVTGTFWFDTHTSQYFDVQINTTDGLILSGANYSATTGFATPGVGDFVEFSSSDLTGQRNLALGFFQSLDTLTTLGQMTAVLAGTSETICLSPDCVLIDPTSPSSRTLIAGGQVIVTDVVASNASNGASNGLSVVPVPAALPMLLAAVAGFGLMRARRQAVA